MSTPTQCWLWYHGIGWGIKERVNKVLHDIVPKISSNVNDDLINDNLPRVVADVVKKEREASKDIVPGLIS
ncbi:hypothetical protein Tco_1515243 [Tanacetum coccineum]